jgi:hypothetical protein
MNSDLKEPSIEESFGSYLAERLLLRAIQIATSRRTMALVMFHLKPLGVLKIWQR